MPAPVAAVVVFLAVVAIAVLVMAILVLLKRVEALKSSVQRMSGTLDPALAELRQGTEVTRAELAALQDATASLDRTSTKRR